MVSRPSFENLFPGTNESGLVGPAVSNDGVAPCAPKEDPEPAPAWIVDIEKSAMNDALNYLRNDANIPSLDLILLCRWAISKQRACDIIVKAKSIIASESAPVDLVGYFRKEEES